MKFITANPPPENEEPIVNTNFWPSVDLADLRDVMRIDGTVSTQRLRHIALNEIASVNGELFVWRDEQKDKGYSSLSAVPADSIGGHSIHLFRYKQAVYCKTKAGLLERYRDYDATNSGNQKAEEMPDSIDDLRRDAAWAISEIQGLPHSTIELI
ncbi:head completion/stabilization protein [Budvicia aquatica]|uniref:Head completion/stabilization protein n=1 Tax=Budvicia aquatica TaxID=82979 RepID=A0A2C6DJ46_9GAMM|nr:head completion/stabilization protein [Budvicia aquatica]PHI29237.1 head completion/stabilization protein [Budvicia aquatica]VFS47450.1 Phage head completion protein (GPL) [Budvicia aquatica]